VRRIRAFAAAFLMVAAITVGLGSPAHADPDFGAQARSAGLTSAEAASLQKRVDGYLAKLGGTQVAANKIDLDGKGVLLLTLPDEAKVRELGTSRGVSAQYNWWDCGLGNFCAFKAQNYTGDMLVYTLCAYQLSMPFADFGSYYNNQTGSVSAHFYDYNHVYMYDSLRSRSMAPKFYWLYVYWIKPCGGV